jgi:hypothetical protein
MSLKPAWAAYQENMFKLHHKAGSICTQLRVKPHQEALGLNHGAEKKKKSFSLTLAVLNVRFPPPWHQKVPKCIAVNRK